MSMIARSSSLVLSSCVRHMSSPAKLDELRQKYVAGSVEFSDKVHKEEAEKRKQQCKVNSICSRVLSASQQAEEDYRTTGNGKIYLPERVRNDCRCIEFNRGILEMEGWEVEHSKFSEETGLTNYILVDPKKEKAIFGFNPFECVLRILFNDR